VVLDWVKGQGGCAIISDAMATSIAKVGDKFTKSIETRKPQPFLPPQPRLRARRPRDNSAAVIGGVLASVDCRTRTLAVLGGFAFFGLWWNVLSSDGPDAFFRRESMTLIRGYVDHLLRLFSFLNAIL
jgi:hypothetical protein